MIKKKDCWGRRDGEKEKNIAQVSTTEEFIPSVLGLPSRASSHGRWELPGAFFTPNYPQRIKARFACLSTRNARAVYRVSQQDAGFLCIGRIVAICNPYMDGHMRPPPTQLIIKSIKPCVFNNRYLSTQEKYLIVFAGWLNTWKQLWIF